MQLEQRVRTRWSWLVVVVTIGLLATACRVDVDSDLSAHNASAPPSAVSLVEPTSIPLVTPLAVPTSEAAATPSPVPTPVRRTPVDPTPAPLTPPTPTLTAEPVEGAVPILDASQRMGGLNVRLNFWIYHRGVYDEDTGGRDLFRTHAWTKESERLTEHGGMTGAIELSPDGRWLAYIVNDGRRSLHVMDVESDTWVDLGRVAGLGFISWSPDSREVLVNHSPEVAPSGAIFAVDIADGSRRTLVESRSHSPSNAVLVDENDLVFWEIGSSSWRLVRMRLDTGERLAELETSPLGYRAYDRDNRVLYLTQRHDNDPSGTVIAIDLTKDGLDVVEIPTPPDAEFDVEISPDGTRVAYTSGIFLGSNELYFVDLADPTAVLHLTLDLGGRGRVKGVEWAPASTAVVFGYGPRDNEQLVVVGQDGTLWPLDVGGVPEAIVPDGT